MAILFACLSTGKGTWGNVARVIDGREWEKIILLTNDFGKEKFTSEKQTEMIVADGMLPLEELTKQITDELKKRVKDTEVYVNFASGSGKEHMAMLSGAMKAGLGFRLIALTKEGVKEI